MFSVFLVHLLVAFSNVAWCAPAKVLEKPVLPTDDSFYQIPNDINNYTPGAIIRYRRPPTPISALRLLPIPLKDSWQILYRTNDPFDRATATVLTVLVPHNADYSKVHSYQAAEDAASPNCAPSYGFQLRADSGGNFGDVLTEFALLVVQLILAQGWVVIVPDHQGPLGAFLANKLAGHAILDGIRAAQSSGNFTGIVDDPIISMWGYSGGGIVTAAAAELQPSYAPELHVSGAAVGGLVPKIMPLITGLNKSPSAGLLLSGVVGLANQYPVMREILDNHTLSQYRPEIEAVRSQCYGANNREFWNKDVVAMFDNSSLFSTEPADSIITDNDLGKQVPTIPLYVYKAINDKVSPIEDSNALVDFYCSGGTSVLYESDLLSDHTSLAITGVGRALAWLKDIMNGEGSVDHCSTKKVVASLLDLDALDGIADSLYRGLLNLLHKGTWN